MFFFYFLKRTVLSFFNALKDIFVIIYLTYVIFRDCFFVPRKIKEKEPPRPPIKRTRWQKIKRTLADWYWDYRLYIYHPGNALRKKAWKNSKILVKYVYKHYYLFIRNYILVRYPIVWYTFIVSFWTVFFCLFSKYYFASIVGFNIFDLLVGDIFVDTVTVYAFSLLELHHAIMWYIFLVLGVVCWSIFGIVRDFSWRKPSLKFDLPVIHLFSHGTWLFFYIESFFLYFFLKVSYIFAFIFYDIVDKIFTEIWFYIITWFAVVYQLVMDLFSIEDEDFCSSCISFLYLHYIDFIVYSWFVGKKSFFKGLKGRISLRGLNLSFYDVLKLNAQRRLDSSFFRPISKAEFLNDSISQALASNRFKHSVVLELVWAGFPLFIIYSMLLPSLILLYSMDVCLDPAFSVKVIGNQWYWSYEVSGWLSDDVNFFLFDHKFDSVLVQEDDLLIGQKRLLEVDNTLILPVNTIIRFLVTSSDVLHSWSLGEAGVKVDAVPGRLNQAVTWFCKPGVFYGQCSELCGVGHGFMPISVEVCSLSNWINYMSEVSAFIVSPCDYTVEGLYSNIYKLNTREWSFQIYTQIEDRILLDNPTGQFSFKNFMASEAQRINLENYHKCYEHMLAVNDDPVRLELEEFRRRYGFILEKAKWPTLTLSER